MDEQEVFATVQRCTLDVLPELDPDTVDLDGRLVDLGANSIDRADIATMAMEQLGIAVPVAEFQRVHDIRSLVRLLQRHT